jgi:hypothetical protein
LAERNRGAPSGVRKLSALATRVFVSFETSGVSA